MAKIQKLFDSNESNKNLFCDQNGSPLDKLAQLESVRFPQLAKRAKAKYFTNAFAVPLSQLKSPLQKSYNNTIFGCSNTLIQQGQTLTSTYCNNRWCIVCNRIRTAKMINAYTPALKKLECKHFVTLTIPNVGGKELRKSIEEMTRNFQNTVKFMRKKKVEIIGLRKLECTYNPSSDSYHPHFHLIVDSRFSAETLVKEWLNRYPKARKVAQDFRPADDSTTMEMFKYFTKITTNHVVYVKALDIIFQAMRNLRVYQPFGIEKVSEDIDDIESQLIENLKIAEATWSWIECDWINLETGECLTNYQPNALMLEMCKNIKP